MQFENASRIIIETPDGKDLLGRPMCVEEKVKMDVRTENLRMWIDLAGFVKHKRACVNTVACC
jgi:hypothetical protein